MKALIRLCGVVAVAGSVLASGMAPASALSLTITPYIQVPKLTGDSRPAALKGYEELTGFSLSVAGTRPLSSGRATGTASGTVTATMRIDQFSIGLLEDLATPLRPTDVVTVKFLRTVPTGKAPSPTLILTYVFKDVVFTSYLLLDGPVDQSTANQGTGTPEYVQVTFTYLSLTSTYSGSPAGSIAG